MKRFFSFVFAVFVCVNLHAQNSAVPRSDYYSAPVKIPIFLSGNFAELRSNHFHGGIDIKTQGRTGIEVLSAADGYVSRILVSPTGFGRALYIDHDNGTTTVYGHLESFASRIDDYIRNIQYEKESFAIDQTVLPGLLPVKKGEVIALSGNAGSSAGPHLHFEIRQTKEEVALNPLLFEMPVKDKAKPVIEAIMVYPLSDGASVSGKQTAQRFGVVKTAQGYQLKPGQSITAFGKIGFGIKTYDLLDGSANHCGIYSLKLFADGQLIYSFELSQVPINATRYANSLSDYAVAMRSGQRFYRGWIEPGNKLDIFGTKGKLGTIDADGGKTHQIKFELADVYGNQTSFSFKVKSAGTKLNPIPAKGELFRYDRDNSVKDEGIRFSIPKGALYDDVDFQYEKKPAPKGFFSPVYKLHNSLTPMHFACHLRIEAHSLPPRLREKVMLAQIDPSSGRIYSLTGKYNDGWVEGNIRFLGNYALAVDTVAPKIVPLAPAPPAGGKTQAVGDVLKFKVTDNLSGIEKFRGTIDGQWVMFEYDLKNNLLSYVFDKKRHKFGREHKLILEVADYCGNKSSYQTVFYK